MPAEARTEVRHQHCAARGIGEFRLEHGGVADVALSRLLQLCQLDAEHALHGIAAGRGEQRRENRIPVGPWQAAPDDRGLRIDQCRNLAIADDAQLQRRLHDYPFPDRQSASSCSQRRVAAGLSRDQRADTRLPTATSMPPWLRTAAKPSKSVTSSPRNTGVQPWKGRSFMNASMAVALLWPAGFSSTTCAPSMIWKSGPSFIAASCIEARAMPADCGAPR